MEKIKKISEFLVQVKATLEQSNSEALDLDLLYEHLDPLITGLSEHEKISTELQQLRDDYQQRIAGMKKAIAVTKHNDDEMKLALTEIDNLRNLSVMDLIDCYKNTQTKFRVSFPASFGQLALNRSKSKHFDHQNYQ